jgi:hypothetical protein
MSGWRKNLMNEAMASGDYASSPTMVRAAPRYPCQMDQATGAWIAYLKSL